MTDHLKSKLFVHAPFKKLRDNLADYIAQGIQPEIGLEGTVLYEESHESFAAVGKALQEVGLSCTLHAPFFELYPGSLDPKIRQVSRDKLNLAFDLILLLQPKSVVCHLGFEDNKHSYKEEAWFSHSFDAWQHLATRAGQGNTTLMLENTYETGPTQLKKMLSALDSPHARFCFDVGHVLAFAKNSWQDWLPELTPWLGQLHLHDNMGERDLHLAVGEGVFNFTELFDYLQQEHLSPLLTMEPHHEGGMEESFTALANIGVGSRYFP